MVNISSRDYTSNKIDFIADEVSDLDILPTLKSYGKDNLSTISSAGVGSSCFVISTGDVYMLKGKTNSWVKI